MKLAERIFKRKDWYVTSNFGYRDPINTSAGVTGTFHNGCDYGTKGEKWKQYALEEGTVLSAGIDSYGGKYAWVKYPRLNIQLLHYHLDTVNVKTGQSVNSNTVIGTTGMSGMATGIHLHLGMKYLNNNSYVDPHNYDYKEEIKTNINQSNIYIVQKGDTLSIIASKYNTTWQKIYNDNKSVIGTNPNLIKPGQKLVIKSNVSCETYHIVQKGETLSIIAKKHNTTWQKIYNDNKGVIGNNPNLIKPGQKLVIK